MDSKQRLDQANTLLGNMVAQVADDQWELTVPATPDWTVRQLVNHFSNTTLMIVDVLRGDEPTDEMADLDDENPLARWQSAAQVVGDFLSSFDGYDEQVEAGGGKISAEQFMSMILGDRLAHTWDLAGAIGVDPILPADLVQAAYDTWEPIAAGIPRGNGLSEIVDVPADSSLQDKFLALTGRDPR